MNIPIESVLIDLVMASADRGVIVRNEPKGLIVLLLGTTPMDLAQGLVPLLEELGEDPVMVEGQLFDGRPSEQLTLQSPIQRILEHGDASPRHWLCFGLRLHDVTVHGYVFSGDELCRRVADICNQHRCPCSFDEKAAPGFRITKHLHH